MSEYKILIDTIAEALSSEGDGWYKFRMYVSKDGGEVFVHQPCLTLCLDKPVDEESED